ncbi:MAG: hypothetical protein ACI9JO_001499, partial [Psychrobacter okhotskensis]
TNVGCGFSPAFCFCKDLSWAKATAYANCFFKVERL